MRGQVPIDVPVPVAGWRTDLPPHRLPPNALRDGQNMLLGLDGLLAVRPGVQRLPAQPAGGGRIVAGLNFRDVNGAIQVIIANLNHWYFLNGGVWTSIADVHGDGNVAARFVEFGSPGGQSAVYGINGEANDPLRQWIAGALTTTQVSNSASGRISNVTLNNGGTGYAVNDVLTVVGGTGGTVLVTGIGAGGVITGIVFQSGGSGYAAGNNVATTGGSPGSNGATVNLTVSSGPTTIAASDMDVIGDRLVLVDTAEVGGGNPGHFDDRIRWSSVMDGTSFPDLAFNRWPGIGKLVAVRATSRTAGVFYGETGAGIMYAVPGDDASAFAFDLIEGVTAGPLSPACLVNVGGVHYYLGTDYHVWRCDGQSGQQISASIDAGIAPGARTTSLATQLSSGAPVRAQTPCAVYDETQQRIWFFVAQGTDENPQGALVLNLRLGVFELPQRFPVGITCAFPAIEQFAPTWDEPGDLGTATLAAPLDAVQTTVACTALPVTVPAVLGVVSIGTEYISYRQRIGNTLTGCTRGDFGSTAAAHLAGAVVTAEITWQDNPWPNWNAIPDAEQPVVYLGAVDGTVARLAGSAMDPGNALIPYRAQWGLIASPNPVQELQINAVDAVLEPVEGDDVLLHVELLRTAFDPAPLTLVNHTLIGNDPPTGDVISSWEYRLDADPTLTDLPAFQPANYLNAEISGQSGHGGPHFAGAALYGDPRKRADLMVMTPVLQP